MTWIRGDILAAVVPGDLGKPRPVVIVQAGAFVENHASVTVCPLTTHRTGLHLFRSPVVPDKRNGLNEPSEIMVDKVSSLRRERFGAAMGRLSVRDLRTVDEALRRWLALADR